MKTRRLKIAILTAILGNFDTPFDSVSQALPPGVEEVKFHRFTDENFPPITGLTPRFQYRIAKLFGWQMVPGFDYYLWLDGSMSFLRHDSLKWFFGQVKGYDMALFKHPWRKTIREEVEVITQALVKNKRYITSRYKNGLHQEQLEICLADPAYKDNVLYTSTAFMYKNNKRVQKAMKMWWYYQSRYFTCDQVVLPYVVFKSKLKVKAINKDQYNIPHMTLVSKHK
jgi:hypothetical protein